mmetsp:Transcript_17372/g.54261  ORF Transcript_17372/g.54261 Transcript_17372/m.54261 type:complete len:437 (+) Transcript_17372:415-1725(+)
MLTALLCHFSLVATSTAAAARFGVVARAYNEDAYLDGFIDHYVKIGFDRIGILQLNHEGLDQDHYEPPPSLAARVKVYRVSHTHRTDDVILARYRPYAKDMAACDWIFYPDVDEYLVLDVPRIDDFVRERLAVYSDINVFMFRWVLLNRVETTNADVFADDSMRTAFVGKGDIVKSMVKTSECVTPPSPHIGTMRNPRIFVNGVYGIGGENISLRAFQGDRASDMRSALVHFRTRSLGNIVVKTLDTKILGPLRSVQDGSALQRLFEAENCSTPGEFATTWRRNHALSCLSTFITALGLKAACAFVDYIRTKHRNIPLAHFHIPEYEFPFIDAKKESRTVINVLERLNYTTGSISNFEANMETISAYLRNIGIFYRQQNLTGLIPDQDHFNRSFYRTQVKDHKGFYVKPRLLQKDDTVLFIDYLVSGKRLGLRPTP